MNDDFVKKIQADFDAYISNKEAVKYIFLKYRREIDDIEKFDFDIFFTKDRLENEEAVLYKEGLEECDAKLHVYIEMLKEHDYSFLYTDYEDDNIDHFFGNPMIISTVLREKEELLRTYFNEDQMIIIGAIAEVNLRYNRLNESVIKIKELNNYKSLWLQDPLEKPQDGACMSPDLEHVHPLST